MSLYRLANPERMTLTLGGMYSYDQTIFDGIEIPVDMDKNALVNTILARCGGNEVRYPSLPILATMIQTFFVTNKYKIDKLWETTKFDYEPLVNYDLEIEVTRKHQGTDRTDTKGNSNNSSSGTTENQVSAFNQTSYTPSSKSTFSDSGKSDSTENETFQTDRNETETRHEHGDNSARSTQYMIGEERQVADFNIYNIIADMFEDEITIAVYGREQTNIFNNYGGLA